MSKAILVASLAWPLLMAAAVGASTGPAPSRWPAAVYLAASRICHQRPERSFHTAGVRWPVCARCSGLYLAAPFGAVAALRARRRRWPAASAIWLAGLAAAPTAVTWAIEWLGIAPVSNLARTIAALPLGVAVAFLITRVSASKNDRVN